MTAAVSGLETHLGFWLRAVSNHVSHSFAAKLANDDVTVAEWAVMRTLFDREPIAPSRVAETMGMTRGAISKLADRLIAKSLATRAPDPDDARAQMLALTGKGRDLVPRLAALADTNDAAFFGVLTASERRELERLLKAIVAARGLTAMPLD